MLRQAPVPARLKSAWTLYDLSQRGLLHLSLSEMDNLPAPLVHDMQFIGATIDEVRAAQQHVRGKA